MPSLYVAYDDRLAIVSRLPVGVIGGPAHEYSWGSVLEITPAEPGKGRQTLAAVMYTFGVWFGLLGVMLLVGDVFVGGLLLLVGVGCGVGGVRYSRRRQGVISAPRLAGEREQHRVLVDDEDRKVFSDAIDLCQRASSTWPGLGALVDVPTAERQLAEALFDLAGALERRQELRELLRELTEHDGAVELASRTRQVSAAVAELDDEVRRRLASLDAVAVAGEELIRDQEIDALAREVDEVLARLTSASPSSGSDAGSELAERTEAVLRAYRELT